jgi:hypothetical protein
MFLPRLLHMLHSFRCRQGNLLSTSSSLCDWRRRACARALYLTLITGLNPLILGFLLHAPSLPHPRYCLERSSCQADFLP